MAVIAQTTTHQEVQHQDYHGHPNYIAIWGVLLGLLGLSLLAGLLGNTGLAVALIFGLAIVKTGLVIGNFMHIRWEPKSIWLIAFFAVLCVGFFYFGVLPDILWVPLELAK